MKYKAKMIGVELGERKSASLMEKCSIQIEGNEAFPVIINHEDRTDGILTTFASIASAL